MAKTRLGLIGAPGRPYAAFTAKGAVQPLGVLSELLGIKFISVRRSAASRSIDRGTERRSIKREVKQ